MQLLKRILGHSRSKNKYLISSIFNVDETSKRHGGELVAEALKTHGVHEVFTLCGGHISPILVSCEQLGIRVIDTRHEVTTVYAADAAARLRQSIGVAAVTSGPGLTNTVTAVKNAQMAESPVLLLGGAAPTLMQNRGALQDIDQLSIFRSICKYTARITKLTDIGPTLQKAMHTARSGTPGPVFVELPIDILYPYSSAGRDCYIPNATGYKKLLNAYYLLHISRQFSRAWEPQNITPLPVDYPKPTSKQIESITNSISNAKRPLLLMGSQATLPPVSAKELRSTVEQLGMPTYLGGMCRGLLGVNSSIQFRQNRRNALKEADVVILAGTVADFRLDYGKLLSPGCKVIAINRDPVQLKKNLGVYWSADELVKADIGTTLVEVKNQLALKGWKCSEDWPKSLREREDQKEKQNQNKMSEKPADGNLNPLNVLSTLDKVLPEDAIVVGDGGDFVASAAYIVRPRGPLQWLDPGAFGTLGVGGGFALGAKAVYPDRPVVIIYGDGSAGYSIMEFDSFVRQKLPVTALVGNDACWTQIAREQIPMFKTNVACDLEFTSYEKTVESLGAKGYLLDKKSENAESMIKEAIEGTRKGKSSLINAIVGKSNFREGSLSV
ncbi:thiamine pyrophosphate enzyme, central domain-containing protein [Ditylenchus destructor]|uniref:2-hydroxyacyl-CoA lyase 2 n=1 Tax=Ditylenchus destructor TaxID=166010 RepID=A0AAD4MY24_9BILA|nr:thiamine pyrophosphate enzyme, central domain-containing protein [Ditylenchus destructor]